MFIIRISDIFYIITSGYVLQLYPFESSSGWSIIYLRKWYMELAILFLLLNFALHI